MAGKSGAEFRDGIVVCVGFGEPSDALLQLPAVSCGTTDSQRFPSTLVTDPKDGGGNRQGGTRLRVTVEKA